MNPQSSALQLHVTHAHFLDVSAGAKIDIIPVESVPTLDPMTTAAAIDRLVHHSVIIELNIPSYRMEAAKKDRDPASQNSEAN